MSKQPIIQSFTYAIKGLSLAVSERNFRLHLLSTLLVVALGFIVKLTSIEWMVVLFCIGLVLSMELVNTAIEEIVNFISPEYHVKAGKIKDLAAAAVLVASIAVFIIALIIFIPHLSIML